MSFGPYTPIRQAGGLYFTSGQIGIAPGGSSAPQGIAAQTRQVLDNLRSVLAPAGLILDDVIKTTVFLTDMRDFAELNAVYQEYFSDPKPARSCIEVSCLPIIGDEKILVEIEAVAVKRAEQPA